jgi:hypothetical protein
VSTHDHQTETDARESPPRVELYVRSLEPSEARDEQERVIERLRELDDEGRIRAAETVLCGECVCPMSAGSDGDIGSHLLRRYEAFKDWATNHGRTLAGFEERHTESVLTGTTLTELVFPRLTLAEYRDGRLSYVAPSTDGTETTTVADRLETY